MKIVYLLDWDIIDYSSVLNKIVNMIQFWECQGCEVHFVIVSSGTVSEFIPNLKNVKVFERPRFDFLLFSSLKTFIGRNIAFNKISKYLRQISPDAIYYRPGSMWYPNINKCLRKAPVILEINSIDENEVKLYYKEKGIRYRIFYYGRRQIIKESVGIIALTKEISNYLSFSNKPIRIIANGIKNEPGQFHKSQRNSYVERPQIIFVGTPGQVWQGFDKFVEMAKYIPEADFHLVGPVSTNGITAENLKVYGYLRNEQLEELYRVVDIGVGTLALYRKEMNEACPLKVREYIAHGLPVILGFKDTDVDGQDFVLNIGCYENNVKDNIMKIKDFILEWHRNHVSADICERLIGLRTKEKIRLHFIADVFKNTIDKQ